MTTRLIETRLDVSYTWVLEKVEPTPFGRQIAHCSVADRTDLIRRIQELPRPTIEYLLDS